jgi:negative regulator of sigma E activity
MNAYKQYLTITNSQELILSNLPFNPGQKVEVIILPEEDQETEKRLNELKEKIDIATKQIEEGKIVDGEVVFQEIKELLRENYGVE